MEAAPEPFLRTKNLDLYLPVGPLRQECIEYQLKVWADPETTAFLAVNYSSEERIEKRLQQREANGGTSYLIKIRATKEPIGFCGLNYHSEAQKQGEFGIMIYRDYWRFGYATEVHLACFSHYFEDLGIHKIIMNTDLYNYRMRGFCDKIGMTCEAIQLDAFYAKSEWVTDASYVLLSGDWAHSKAILSGLKDAPKNSFLFLPILYYVRDYSLKVAELKGLMHAAGQVLPEDQEKQYHLALIRTINVTARIAESGQLVGVARVLTDGLSSSVTQMVVHPDHVGPVTPQLLALAAAPHTNPSTPLTFTNQNKS